MRKRLDESSGGFPFSDLPINRAPRIENLTGIEGRICFVTLANVVDVSLGGVGIETQETLQLDHLYKIYMDGTVLTLDGRAVWHQHTDTREDEAGELVAVFRSGLQFDRSSVWSQRESLQHFLDLNAERPTGARRAMPRFRLRSDTPRVLQTNFPFKVRTLSATGMMAECDRLPAPNSILNLVIELPHEAIRIKATMVDVFEDLEGDQLKRSVAFGFEDSSPYGRQAIATYVRQHAN